MLTATKNVWKYQAKTAAWYFVSFTVQEVLDGLKIEKKPRGWGQIPVEVKIGHSTWNTSIFPSKKRGYDLPIKASIRSVERIDHGDTVACSIRFVHS